MDIEVILDTAESEAPGLRELARHFLEAEAAHYGMPLDLASVMARRAEDEPELHVTGAADELVRHLAAGPDALGGYSPLMALARVGAPAPVARTEGRMRLRPASQSPRQFAEDLVYPASSWTSIRYTPESASSPPACLIPLRKAARTV
jgi:hypothetical protein